MITIISNKVAMIAIDHNKKMLFLAWFIRLCFFGRFDTWSAYFFGCDCFDLIKWTKSLNFLASNLLCVFWGLVSWFYFRKNRLKTVTFALRPINKIVFFRSGKSWESCWILPPSRQLGWPSLEFGWNWILAFKKVEKVLKVPAKEQYPNIPK